MAERFAWRGGRGLLVLSGSIRAGARFTGTAQTGSTAQSAMSAALPSVAERCRSCSAQAGGRSADVGLGASKLAALLGPSLVTPGKDGLDRPSVFLNGPATTRPANRNSWLRRSRSALAALLERCRYDHRGRRQRPGKLLAVGRQWGWRQESVVMEEACGRHCPQPAGPGSDHHRLCPCCTQGRRSLHA